MPKILSSTIGQEIIDRYIYGDPTSKIEHDLGISHGAVMDRILMVRHQLTKRLVEAIRIVTVALKKNKIPVQMVVTAGRFASILRRMNIDDENFEEFASIVYQGCQSHHLDGEQLTEYASALFKLQKTLDSPISDVLKTTEASVARVKELENTINDSESKEKDARTKLQSSLSHARVTEQILIEYKDTEKFLRRYGIGMKERHKFANILKNAKENDHDLSVMIRWSKDVDSLQKKANLIADENQQLERKKTILERELTKNEKTLDGHKVLVKEIELLKHSGLDAVDVRTIRTKTDDIAGKRHLDERQAFRAFLKDLDSYDAALGFMSKLESLKSDEQIMNKRISELNGKISELNGKITSLQQQYDKRKNVLDSLARLLERGISAEDIITWYRLVDKANTSVEEIYTILQHNADLTALLDAGRKELAKIKDEITMKKAELETLKSRRLVAEGEVRVLAENLKKTVKDIVEENLRALNKSIGDAQISVSKKADEVSEGIESLAERCLETGKELQKYRNFETLMSMYLGKAGVSDQSLIVLYTMLDAFEHWIAVNFPKAYNALENCKTLKQWISSQKHAG